jgi:GAF domain-containing protein/anti-sigma regulatory factor (Ser/Thr protein kinase)
MELAAAELRLGAEPDAVPRARRFVLDALVDVGHNVADDAALVATELVTNGLLHAGPPVTVRVRVTPGGVRVEVEDTSRETPMKAIASAEAMTGRGLSLVGALATGWGVDASESGGKVVWAELAIGPASDDNYVDPEMDVDALLAAWGDDEDDPTREETFAIHLGDVPTDLLLSAKAHVDNLVREFTLTTASDAAADPDDEQAARLAQLVESVVHNFELARQAIKRQALAAAARGDERTDLTLVLPLSAADAGEEYLAALDEADSYSRAARLLTLETPPAHRVFRHWYVESLVEQLRHRARGETAPAPPTFEQRLITELGALADAQRASERAARLQTVTAALVAAATANEVMQVVVSEGAAALRASGGGVIVLGPDGIDVAAAVGYGDDLVARLEAERPDDDLPAMYAARTGEPVWLESPAERDTRFPALTGIEPGTVAVCAAPLMSGGVIHGSLRFSFNEPRLFDEDERRFVVALAAQAAQALHRSALHAAERAAREEAERLVVTVAATAERLSLLQQVTARLTGASDLDEIAGLVIESAAAAFGSTSARLYLLGDDGVLRSLRTFGGTAAATSQYHEFPVDADLPGGVVVRTRQPVVVRGAAELAERFPAIAGIYPDDRTLCVAPLSVGNHVLGVLSMTFPPAQAEDEEQQVSFLTTLADACAQAMERAMATARAAAASDKLAFLAAASAELSSSLDYRTTLANIGRLVVPRLADWCTVQIVDHGRLETLAIAHADPDKMAWAEMLQERYPATLDGDSGVPQVIRTGRSELYPEIPEELLVVGAQDEEHLAVLRQVGMSSALIVPLTGRTGTFGAIGMIHAESGRRFDEADRTFAEDLAHRAAIAVEIAHAFQEQSTRLDAVTRVAEAAQRAILAPVPPQIGRVALSARYVSAAAEALIGGDLYEVVQRDGAVRLLIGDVRGKGLDAVRKATVVLGEFRAAAAARDDLAKVARQIDARVVPYVDDEDFVTALLAEITDDGMLTVACCGHPPALLSMGGQLTPVGAHDSLPLGLGASPSLVQVQLERGARLLLYTDGIIEARDAHQAFVEFDALVAPLATGPLDSVLDRLLDALRARVGPELGDDLALVAAEYLGPA